MDSYRYCSFQCEYCFMKRRVIGKRNEHLKPNIKWLRHKFEKVYDDKDINKTDFVEMLLKNRITLNCGTKSDPFHSDEKEEQLTKEIIDLCNEYDQQLIFSTKSDTYYDVDVDPSRHRFQLSITNDYDDKYLEPNVPPFEKRVEFYNNLKDQGFKVGIRFEPYIPNITNIEDILSHFEDVDHVHISRLRLLPQIDNSDLLNYIGCSREDFKTHGLTSLKGEVWYNYLRPTIEYLEDNNYSFGTSFIHFGNCDCLGGDVLGWKTTKFDTFHLKQKYGSSWTLEDGLREIGEYKDCYCYSLFTSNRRVDGCRTVEDYYKLNWGRPNSKIRPEYQFNPQRETLEDFLC